MNGTHAHTTCDISTVVLVVAMAVTVTMAVTGHRYIGHYKNVNFNFNFNVETRGNATSAKINNEYKTRLK